MSYLPTHQNIVEAGERWPEVDSIYLYKAFDTYQNKCSACHYLYHPEKFSEKEWQKLLPEMKEKAKLTEDEYRSLQTYLFVLII